MKAKKRILKAGHESGTALVVAVAALLILSSLALVLVVVSSTERNIGTTEFMATTSFYSADGGAQVGYNKLKRFIVEGFKTLPYDTGSDPNALSDALLTDIVNANNSIGVLSYAFYNVTGRQFLINTASTNTSPADSFTYELYNIANEVDLGLKSGSGYSPSLTMNLRNPTVTTGNFAGTNLNQIGTFTHQTKVTISRDGLATRTIGGNGASTYTFPYKYVVETQSVRNNRIMKTIDLSGTFTLTLQRKAFSTYALFTNKHRNAAGATVYFTNRTNFDGPVHTNGRFYFANNPGSTFTDVVSQYGDEDGNGVRESDYFKLGFYNNGSPLKLDADKNGTRDVPTFNMGIDRRADKIPLPTNTISQKNAALGTLTAPTSAGVYVNNTYGGGIYVKGHVTNLQISLDANGNQVYVFNRGSSASNPTTTTVTLDRANNRTIVVDGNNPTEVVPGLPNGMIYVDGSLGRFANGNDSSSGGVSGIIQRDNQVTIAATGDIFINGSLQYQDPNVNGSNPPQNVMGILAETGDIVIRNKTSSPNDYVIDASVMSLDGELKVENYSSGNPRGTVTLVGGVTENTYGAFGTFSGNTQQTGYGRNFIYDRRFRDGTFSPPFFPVTQSFAGSSTITDVTFRPQWAEK